MLIISAQIARRISVYFFLSKIPSGIYGFFRRAKVGDPDLHRLLYRERKNLDTVTKVEKERKIYINGWLNMYRERNKYCVSLFPTNTRGGLRTLFRWGWCLPARCRCRRWIKTVNNNK